MTVDQNHPQGDALPVFDGNGFCLHNCGEQPLLDYESCNLGSVNLARLRQEAGDSAAKFQELLTQTCRLATRFLDNVIDCNRYPVPAIESRTLETRRIGVGVMGFADLLIMEGIPYDSERGLSRARELMRMVQDAVHQASRELALERGPYPAWAGSAAAAAGEPPMRHTSPTTIAPTGTISIIAGVSSGIEPLFALAYERQVMDRDRLAEFHPLFLDAAATAGIAPDDPRLATVAATGSIAHLDFPPAMKEIFRVSHDIAPEWHVRMQAAWQEHCDNAVSKTVNMPREAAAQDVWDAYVAAWQLGCKGITVYRDGSKDDQVLSTAASRAVAAGSDTATVAEAAAPPLPRKRPALLAGATYRIATGHGTAYVTVNDAAGKPFEVFVAGGKSGGCDEAQSQAITRLASLALRHDVPSAAIARQLEGIICCPRYDNGTLIGSLADAIAAALKRHAGATAKPDADNQPMTVSEPPPANRVVSQREYALIHLAERRRRGLACPEPGCHGAVVISEGCRTCAECGWSNCG